MLNDFLWRGREIGAAARDVIPGSRAVSGGRLLLIPSSIKASEITRVLREGYDAQRLTHGLRRLVSELQLDVLLIDTVEGRTAQLMLRARRTLTRMATEANAERQQQHSCLELFRCWC